MCAFGVELDVTSQDSIEGMVKRVADVAGAIDILDILVNNAGFLCRQCSGIRALDWGRLELESHLIERCVADGPTLRDSQKRTTRLPVFPRVDGTKKTLPASCQVSNVA